MGKLMHKIPKYQYHVQTWGGFYSEANRKIHGLSPGDFVFDSADDRDLFISNRVKISQELNAQYLVTSNTEGFNCGTRVILHRVIEHEAKQYYSRYDAGINFPFDAAKYHIENKWYPGFNDYPLGYDFDYSNVKIVSQWITGAFQIPTED